MTGLGWLIAAPGLGAVLGAFVVASANWLPPNGRLAGIAVAGYLVALAGFAVSTSFGLSLVLLVLVGLLNTVFSACVRTMLQLEATEAYYGRVMSLNTITFIGFSPVGAAGNRHYRRVPGHPGRHTKRRGGGGGGVRGCLADAANAPAGRVDCAGSGSTGTG